MRKENTRARCPLCKESLAGKATMQIRPPKDHYSAGFAASMRVCEKCGKKDWRKG